MLGRVELRGGMTLAAHRVARCPEPEPVRVVAVRARDAGPEHTALHEGPVLVDLSQNLAVGVIEGRLEQGRRVGVEQGPSVLVWLQDGPAPGVAARTRVDLRPRPWGTAPLGDPPLGIPHHPGALGTPETNHQSVPAGR